MAGTEIGARTSALATSTTIDGDATVAPALQTSAMPTRHIAALRTDARKRSHGHVAISVAGQERLSMTRNALGMFVRERTTASRVATGDCSNLRPSGKSATVVLHFRRWAFSGGLVRTPSRRSLGTKLEMDGKMRRVKRRSGL